MCNAFTITVIDLSLCITMDELTQNLKTNILCVDKYRVQYMALRSVKCVYTSCIIWKGYSDVWLDNAVVICVVNNLQWVLLLERCYSNTHV